jgi:hypothetical protein
VPPLCFNSLVLQSSHKTQAFHSNSKHNSKAFLSHTTAAIMSSLAHITTPKVKRTAADYQWTTPPPPPAGRSVIYENDDQFSHPRLFLPDLQNVECTTTRSHPLSFRPQQHEFFFKLTYSDESTTEERFESCPLALPLCSSDSSASDSSFDQSFLANEFTSISFDESELDFAMPPHINLRPRFSFDDFDLHSAASFQDTCKPE